MEDSEDPQAGDEQDEDKSNENSNSDEMVDVLFKWYQQVDIISETMRTSWREVYTMEIMEFFTMLCYYKYKTAKQEAELKKWRMKH